MKQKFRKTAAFLLLAALVTGLFPQQETQPVKAATKSVTLDNLGEHGSVSIGNKTKSGNWWKMEIGDDTAFCMNLGYTCHTGDAYQSSDATYNSSDSGKKGLKAHIGYWFDQTQDQSNKAFIMAQALFWAVEEGDTSETKLKAVISKVKSNTGYFSSKTAGELYTEIFEKSGSFSVKVTEWGYSGSGSHRQKLLVVKASKNIPPKPKRACGRTSYRQKLTMNKKDEEGKPVGGVKFSVEALNLDDLYQYKINDTGTGDVDEDINNFTLEQTTDANGQFSIRYVYQLQSQYYYYLDSDELDAMSAGDKKKKKDEWDDKGWLYGDDLSADGAYQKYMAELEKMKDKIHNSYIIKEIDTASANMAPDPAYVKGVTLTLGKADSTMEWEGGELPDIQSHNIEVVNSYKKATVRVVKKDDYSRDGKAHGAATLDGAVFQLYSDASCTQKATVYGADGKKKTAAEYVTKSGQLETDYLRAGITYYLKETKAPEGYLLNEKTYPILVNGTELPSVEFTPTAKTIEVEEPAIKGKIALRKFIASGQTGPIRPEVGAVFQVYLTQKSSYEACDEYERDTITIDEDGYACTKELYYGNYTVHQVSTGGADTEKVVDFSAEIKEPDRKEPYIFYMDNTIFKAYLRIIKKDGNTKRDVLKEGTTYQIYKVADGKETLVTQEYSNGNKKVTIDRFVTDESGQIMTVQPLESGTYRIYETDAATGYHISTPYIEVEISSKAENYKTETDKDGNTYSTVELTYTNHEAYGILSLKKTGEQLADYRDGQFIYEEKQLKGVVFEIYAADDIETQDNQGTYWFEKGGLVGTITTGEGAVFESECGGLTRYEMDQDGVVTVNLPLGKYRITEKKTLYGYILPEKDWKVEFNWDNKDTEAVLNATDATDGTGRLNVKNQRAVPQIRLVKTDAQTKTGVSGAVFGIYTKDAIYNADGRKIVEAGTQLGTMSTDREGKALYSTDLPLMSEGYRRSEEDGSASGGAISSAAASGDEETEPDPLNSGDYYLKEQEVSGSYYLEGTEYPVHLEYKDQETKTIEAEVKAENIQTEAVVSKTSITNSEELAGCGLQITDADGNAIVGWTSGDKESIRLNEKLEEMGYCNVSAALDEKGSLQVKGLFHDSTYTLTETRPADGYVTADSIAFRLVQGEDGKTLAVLVNGQGTEPQTDNIIHMVDDTTKVEISKTELAGSGEIPGCELEITDKDSGTVMDAWTSTEEKHIIEQKLTAGKTYILTEKRPADGYVTADSIEFTIGDTGEVQSIHMEDDTTKIRLIKLAEDTRQGLPGAKFEVYDSKNKKVMGFTSKEEGYDITGKLAVGETYTIKEVEAPEGYKLAKAVRYTVKDTGEVQKVSITDEKIPAPKVPQTGGSTPTALLGISIGMAAAILAVVAVRRRKHKTGKK